MSSTTNALKAVATGQVSGAPRKTLFDHLQNPKFQKGLGAVASKYLTPERMLSLCINAVKKTPKLMECDPQSVLGAMMASAALGLEPNTLQQQAFLIPYKRRTKIGDEWVTVYDCQFQVGARGFVTLAYRSPHIKLITADAIHDGDVWEQQLGSETFLRYAKSLRERGGLLGAFSYVRYTSGDESACVLPLDELMKIRAKSETYRSLVGKVESAQNEKDLIKAKNDLAETPWVMWEDDMAAKSAIKKHAKQLPLTGNDLLAVAAELDSNADAGTLDMRAFSDPDLARAVINDEEPPPQLENQPAETITFPSDAHQGEAQPVAGAEQAKPAAKTRSKPATPPVEDATPPRKSYAQFAEEVKKAKDADAAAVIVDQARGVLPENQYGELGQLFTNTWGNA